MEVYIPYDPYDTAEKEVANYINNYNENNENSLELMKLYEDSIMRHDYDYVAECTMTIAGSTEKKEVFLYCEVFGDGNDFCKIEPQGLNNYGFSENEIKIIDLGYGGDGRLLDSTLEYYSSRGGDFYSKYYEGLMSLVANKIDEQLVNNEVGYYDEYGNCVINLTIQSPCVTIENPYVLVIFFDDDNKEIMKKTQKISATFDNKRTTVSLNLGKLTGASRFKISVLANEVFSKEWLENYLLNEYIWTGKENMLDYYYSFKEHFLDNPDMAQIFYIEQFDLENSSK